MKICAFKIISIIFIINILKKNVRKGDNIQGVNFTNKQSF